MEFVFTSRVIEWRGPAPYYFVPVPEEESAGIAPGRAPTCFRSRTVRKPRGLSVGDGVTVNMTVLFRA